MYSFHPLTINHIGFAIISILGLIVFLASLIKMDSETFLEFIKINAVVVVVVVASWVVSFHVIDQNPYENKQVIGNFVGYQVEVRTGSKGYNYRSAYVIYEVDGNQILLKANEGMTYPKQAILYKN